ncbi:hypothetical protein JK358_38505, partial [Nocardia sp. 2]
MILVAELLVVAVGAVGALLTVGALLWLYPGVLRILGGLLILSNLYRLGLSLLYPWVRGSALLWLAVGVLAWLAGHWLYAARWHAWRSPIAAHTFALPVLRALAPTTGRGHA